MEAPPLPTTPDTSAKWWIAWIIAVIVIPGAIFPVMEALSGGQTSQDMMQDLILPLGGLAALAAFILHLTASIKASKGKSGWLTVLLLLGGWFLGFVSLFAGCILGAS